MWGRRGAHVVSVVLVAAFGAGGCGSGVSFTTTPASPEPGRTTVCPGVPGDESVSPGCDEFFDGEAAMGANRGYRERSELSPENRERAAAHRDRITALLVPAAADGPLDRDAVERLLEGVDAVRSVAGYGRSDEAGLALGISTVDGCVYGGVDGSEVSLEPGGGIADGGCLPAQGH